MEMKKRIKRAGLAIPKDNIMNHFVFCSISDIIAPGTKLLNKSSRLSLISNTKQLATMLS